MTDVENWKALTAFGSMIGSLIGAGVAIWKAREARTASQATIASNYLKSKQEMLHNGLLQLHEIEMMDPLIDYTSEIGESAAGDLEAGRKLLRSLIANNTRIHRVLLPISHLATSRQDKLQEHLTAAQRKVSAFSLTLQAHQALDEHQLAAGMGPISDARTAMSVELQSELEDTVKQIEQLGGLRPRQTWRAWAGKLSKNVLCAIFGWAC